MSEKHGGGLRISLLLGSLVTLLAIAGVSWRRDAAREHGSRTLTEVQRIEARLAHQVDRRPALWGGELGARAWPHYEAALEEVSGWDPRDLPIVRRAQLAEEGSGALEELHRGAHAPDATRQLNWSLGAVQPTTVPLLSTRMLIQAAGLRMETLLEEDRDLDAVGVLLDGMQLAGDLTNSPLLVEAMIGTSQLAPDSLVRILRGRELEGLSGAARARLDHGLTALDARLEWAPRVEPEIVLAARSTDRALTGELWAAFERTPTRGRERTTLALRALMGLREPYPPVAVDAPHLQVDRVLRLAEQPDSRTHAIERRSSTSIPSAARSRLYSIGRFKLLRHAFSGEGHVDPDLVEFLREEHVAGQRRIWLDHEVFDGLAIIAPN